MTELHDAGQPFLAVHIRDVAYSYPAARRQPAMIALNGVSLEIPSGQTVALLGPNGSGKSTLMKLLCGTLPIETGSLTVFGQTGADERRRFLSVVFQSNGLDPHLTVGENLRCQAQLYGLGRDLAKRRIDEELDRGGLTDRRHSIVRTLSLGLSRRVDLCRAMLHRPRLLLLDEPTVGLDPVAREAFLNSLEIRRRTDHLTILMSTHLIDEADRCDRVVLLHQGRIIADDSPAALRHQMGDHLITVLDTSREPPAMQGLSWERRQGVWRAAVDQTAPPPADITGSLAQSGYAFSVAPPTLADVFEHLTGESLSKNPTAPVAESAA